MNHRFSRSIPASARSEPRQAEDVVAQKADGELPEISRSTINNAASIGFLFNHESVHQVAHSAPIIAEIVSRHPEVEVTVLVSTDVQSEAVQRYMPEDAGDNIRIAKLELSPFYELLSKILSPISPYRRMAVLKDNLDIFRSFDALVVPEATSLMLTKRFGLDQLKLIYTQHGAGDRSIGFSADVGEFDFVLLSGRKVADRLKELGYIDDESSAVVGYPKFDTIASSASRPKLFDNDRPTVLYNPHFEPRLSSWYRMGRDVLEFFYQRPEYNLILAPHVMLFKRRLHTSLEILSARIRRDVPAKYYDCDNILIDTGSEACVDMTYTRAADVYIGDASSQVYEFIISPRPCIFLNSHGADWEGDTNYLHWTCGPVLTDVSGMATAMAAAMTAAVERPDAFRDVQQQLADYTFDRSDIPPSQRAASAIVNYVNSVRSQR